jgi:hypothetical protein
MGELSMEILARNLHARLQEMCDCYLETDFLAEMQRMNQAPVTDPEEDALKYLSLALMHAVSEKVGTLKLERKKGELKVSVKNEAKETLPPPPPELFDKIIKIMRGILHLEEDKVELPLALGLRNGQLELLVKIKHEPEKDSLKFKFPAW